MAAVVDEQNLARIGALGGEIIVVVAGQRIGGIDADFAFAETVGGFESQEFDLARGRSRGRPRFCFAVRGR